MPLCQRQFNIPTVNPIRAMIPTITNSDSGIIFN